MMESIARLVFFLAVFALSGVSQPSFAQKAAPAAEQPAPAAADIGVPAPRIAVIDVQTILRESKAAGTLRDQLDDHRRKYRDEVAKMEDGLRDEQQELNRQRSVLTPDAFEKKRQEWEQKASALSRDVEARKQQLDMAFENSLAQIQNALVKVVRRISEEENINLVLAKTQVLLVSSEMDITADALIGLDKELPSVKLEVAAVRAVKKMSVKK